VRRNAALPGSLPPTDAGEPAADGPIWVATTPRLAEAGLDDVLSKPVDPQAIGAPLRHWREAEPPSDG